MVIFAPVEISLYISSVVFRAFWKCENPVNGAGFFFPFLLSVGFGECGSDFMLSSVASAATNGLLKSGFKKSKEHRMILPTFVPIPFFLQNTKLTTLHIHIQVRVNSHLNISRVGLTAGPGIVTKKTVLS
jgi:hypothetical protein